MGQDRPQTSQYRLIVIYDYNLRVTHEASSFFARKDTIFSRLSVSNI